MGRSSFTVRFLWESLCVVMLVGVLGLNSLAIEQYRRSHPRIVRILGCHIQGHRLENRRTSVTTVIEDAMTALDGSDYIDVQLDQPGSGFSVSLTFPTILWMRIMRRCRCRITCNLSHPRLPESVQQQGRERVTVDSHPAGRRADTPEGGLTNVELGDLISKLIEDRVKRTPGVGSISTFGSGYAMRTLDGSDEDGDPGIRSRLRM